MWSLPGFLGADVSDLKLHSYHCKPAGSTERPEKRAARCPTTAAALLWERFCLFSDALSAVRLSEAVICSVSVLDCAFRKQLDYTSELPVELKLQQPNVVLTQDKMLVVQTGQKYMFYMTCTF